jgi:hypothetical protein
MGCCSGKELEGDIMMADDYLQKMMDFKDTGVGSVDDFGGKLKALLGSLEKLSRPLMLKKNSIMRLTKFQGKKFATLRHVIVGIVVLALAYTDGDTNKIRLNLKIDFPPYMEADLDNVSQEKDMKDAAEAFRLFKEFLGEAVVSLAEQAEPIVT